MALTTETDILNLLKKLDERFDKIDRRFDKVDERFNKVDERFNKVEQNINDLKVGLAELRGEIREEYAELKGGFNGLSKRTENLEFISRGILIGLVVAFFGAAAKLLGFVPNNL